MTPPRPATLDHNEYPPGPYPSESPLRKPALWIAALAFTMSAMFLAAPQQIHPRFIATASAATLTAAQAELTAAKAELAARQAALDTLAQRYFDADHQLADTEERITVVQADVGRASADLATLQVRLNERLRGIYMDGDMGSLVVLDAIFGSDELMNVLNRLDMLSRVLSEDEDVFSQVESQVALLEGIKAELGEQQQAQKGLLSELDQANQDALQALEDTKDEYNALREKVRRLEAEEKKRREEEAARLAAESARQAAASQASNGSQTTTSSSSGGSPSGGSSSGGSSSGSSVGSAGWHFPVQGPNSFINDWGYARSGGRSHKGTDIMTARNTPLVAVVSGVVSRTSSGSGLGGITIWLNGDDGNSYYYAHLTSIASGISGGVRVSGGQTIGYAGNTGNARGGEPHLHFEIHPGGGSAINPYPTLIANR